MKYLLLVFSAFLSQHVFAQKFKIDLVQDINIDSFDLSHPPKILCSLNGKLILANVQTYNGNYFLYSLDVADSNRLELLSTTLYNPSEAIVLGNQIIFSAEDLNHGLELWSSDGTASGTKLLKDIYPGKNGSNIKGLSIYNDKVYFSANDSLHGQELWHSDGSTNSTLLLKDIDTGVSSSNPNNFIVYNGKLTFEAYTKNAMYQLYASNGTEAATNAFTQVQGYKDFHFVNSKLFMFNGKLYFSGFDPINGDQLWSSNGTLAGTSLLKVINTSGNSSPRDFIQFKNQLVFTANNGTDGYELWMSDGSSNNTKALTNKNPQLFVNRPESLLVFNNYMYYSLNDGIGGFELWRTDLNSSTQTLVKDINPGVASSYVSAPIIFKGLMVFSAVSMGDNQVWISDGTENGTRSVLFPSSNKKNPLNVLGFKYFELANKLYFPAFYKGNVGAALYVLDIDLQSGFHREKDAAFTVYPNPLNAGVLSFSETISGEIVNQLGQTVLLFKQSAELDLHNLTNGVYWIKTEGYKPIKIVLSR